MDKNLTISCLMNKGGDMTLSNRNTEDLIVILDISNILCIIDHHLVNMLNIDSRDIEKTYLTRDRVLTLTVVNILENLGYIILNRYQVMYFELNAIYKSLINTIYDYLYMVLYYNIDLSTESGFYIRALVVNNCLQIILTKVSNVSKSNPRHKRRTALNRRYL